MKTVCNRKITGLLTFFDKNSHDSRAERIYIKRSLYTINNAGTLIYDTEMRYIPEYYTNRNLILKNYTL